MGRCHGRRTSRQDRRSERRICPSLSWPFAAGPASSLFVVGCRRYPSCDTYQVPGHSYLLLDHAVRFFPFFCWFFQTNSRGLFAAACCCVLLLYFYYFVTFHVSFSAKVYAQGPHGGCVRSKKRGNLRTINLVHEIKVIVLPARLCYC